MADYINKFDSVEDALAFINPRTHITRGTAWYGRDTRSAIAYVKQGAGEAEQDVVRDMLSKIDDAIPRERREMVASPVGSRAHVPDFIQGMPFNMRRRAHVEREFAPVRIVVETLVSAKTPLQALAMRGAATAALAMILAETRPVELYASWCMRLEGDSRGRHGNNVTGMVKLDTAPLSLAHLVAVMATPEWMRSIAFAIGGTQAGYNVNMDTIGIHWGWKMHPGDALRIKRLRDTLGLEDTDVFVQGGHLDYSSDIVRDPVKWVNDQVDKQRNIE